MAGRPVVKKLPSQEVVFLTSPSPTLPTMESTINGWRRPWTILIKPADGMPLPSIQMATSMSCKLRMIVTKSVTVSMTEPVGILRMINTCGSTYCWDIHMVIDDNDHIHLAYTTYTQWDETLVYMNYDGTTWTDTVVSSSAHFGPIGIAVDSNNHPHISYAARRCRSMRCWTSHFLV